MRCEMRIKLVNPFDAADPSGSSAGTFKIVQLNLPLLAAYTPPEHDVEIVDESFAPDKVDEDVDLVGVTVMTELAPRAYCIGDTYRKRGVKVVMGGIHPTVLPEEALRHADAVVLGEGEQVWPQVVSDAAAGRLRRLYRPAVQTGLGRRPLPRRGLYPLPRSRSYTPLAVAVEASRGCPYDCEFCSVGRVMGHRYRLRPVPEVIEDIESAEGAVLMFVDDNFGLNRPATKELFHHMIPLRRLWVGQGAVSLAEDPELLNLMRRSGCTGLLIGFETVHERSQSEFSKLRGLKIPYAEAVRRFHDEGIMVLGAFVFGLDEDDRDTFDRTLEFAMSSRLDLVQFRHLAPYPGTRVYDRLLQEDRLPVADWWLRGLKPDRLLFRPRLMTEEEFEDGIRRIKQEFYSARGIARRLFGIKPWKRDLVSLATYVGANMGTRKRYYAGLKSPRREPHGTLQGMVSHEHAA
jgi:radical SAM superfamily enzyme YgiQ (UPF0313 family)